jgi:pimeloyl-ACP methyl ester carboxylesterase
MIQRVPSTNPLFKATSQTRWSRRHLLKNAALAGLAASTMGGALAGCTERSRQRARERAEAAEEERDFPDLEIADINGVELAVWDSGGDGDPVVFIHGGMGYEVMPLITEPALTERFRLIHYTRRGYGSSPQSDAPTTIPERAEDCRAVMEHFGVERAHVESLSGGGPIALQLALDYPEAVNSLALLEPALSTALADSEQIMGVIGTTFQHVEQGDLEGAVEVFAGEVVGEDHFEAFDQNMPEDWFESWAMEMETIFFYDLPGEEGWDFTEEDAVQIDQPVLNMMGGDSPSYWDNVFDHVATLFPQAENVVLPNAPYTMPGVEPAGTALQLAAFYARHPI